MATYSTKIIMSDNDMDYYFRVEEIPNLTDNSVTLEFYLDRNNKAEEIKYRISVNGEKGNALLEEISGKSVHLTSKKFYLSEDGNGHFDIELELWADKSLFGYFWKANGTATISFDATRIDNSNPYIYGVNASANRYGVNAFVSFFAEHDTYELTDIQLILKGLSSLQASARMNVANGADAWERTANVDGTFDLQLTKNQGLSKYENVKFDLDVSADDAPLDSGQSHVYQITVTALNGKSTTVSGLLNVPQKVTGISCAESIDLSVGQTESIEYLVSPSNAEEQRVMFTSSDTEIAEIDSDGLLTAKAEGSCKITLETVDGGAYNAASGFVAECYVNVFNSLRFPELNEIIDYLTANQFSKIGFAADFVRNELINIGASVEEFENSDISGKSQPVTAIKTVFSAMENNCHKLRTAAAAQGIETATLPEAVRTINKENTDWIIIVNGWISFLKELHSKINGGG